MTYTIGEVAEKLNLSPSTLRYYDKEGLLPFIERSESGTRLFKDSDLDWLKIIDCLKQTGMSIKNIKTFIDWCIEGDATIEKRLDLIMTQRQAVISQIEQLKKTLHTLDYKEWYYQVALKAGTCRVHDRLAISDIPEIFKDDIPERNGDPHEI